MRLCTAGVDRDGRDGVGSGHWSNRKPLGDPVEHAMRHFGIRFLQCVAECQRVRGAVALDHHSLEPDQRRAVIATRIDAALEGIEGRKGEYSQSLSKRVTRELLAEI